MKLEDRFDIRIPDHLAERIVTIGELQAFVIQELGQLGGDLRPRGNQARARGGFRCAIAFDRP